MSSGCAASLIIFRHIFKFFIRKTKAFIAFLPPRKIAMVSGRKYSVEIFFIQKNRIFIIVAGSNEIGIHTLLQASPGLIYPIVFVYTFEVANGKHFQSGRTGSIIIEIGSRETSDN